MNHNYQMTVQEFADLIAKTVCECGYFQKGQLAHPEDIEAAFSSVATAVAAGATFMIGKINDVKSKFDYTKTTTTVDSSGNVYSTNKI